MIRQNPLWGVGVGNWSVVYPAYAPEDDPSVVRGAFSGPQISRNDLLAVVAEWGVVGFGVGFSFLMALAAQTARLLINQNEQARSAGLLMLGVALTALALGIFDSVIRVAPTVVLLALLVGLAMGDGEAAGVLTPVTGNRELRALGTIVAGAYAVVSFVLAYGAAQDIAALRIINSATSTRGLARAVNVAPHNVEARGLLAYVLVAAHRCEIAMPHLTYAAQLQPFSLYIVSLQQRCRQLDERQMRLLR